MGTIHLNSPPEKKKFEVEIKEFENSSGATLNYERYETTTPISSIVHGKKYKVACEACHKFGKNLACPPYSPGLAEYLDEQNHARIICIRMPQEYFRHVIQEEIYRECFRKARSILVEELLRYRERGYAIAGSGSCLACDVCAVEEGSCDCKNPNKKIYSLESLGVNLITLTKMCFDFDLEWSANEHAADFICSIGAIFMYKNK